METDDDTFVNPLWIVEWLKGMPYTNYVAGKCDMGKVVVRDKGNKW